MLSVENPLPDPSCSSQFQPLNSNSDERVSTKEPNLPNSDLNHRPNFSIRDYVFTARSRDIKNSWPFSSKNLQLCLKHGVKELLPPFDTVSRQSPKRCVVETSSLQKEKTGSCAVRESNSSDLQLNYKLVESCFDNSSCRSEDENDFPSTTTTASHSETKPLSKKCRLIVKFGGNSDRISTEDIASASTVSKIMGSNVCPVCKTFSSSSNTTLNAHIDQCLSVESTPRWSSDSKLKRQRIKPRKTRLMVDIYSTALPCTLEELDRRNGTSWAAGSCLPMQEIDEKTGNEGKRMRVPQSHPEDIGDVGPVYVDSNGRKVRILSKSDDLPSLSKVAGAIDARKPQKGEKVGKFISKKKKKHLAQKHHGFQKLAPQSKMNFSLNAHASQIVEEECEGFEEENRGSNQPKQSDSITLKPWVCSKRRVFTTKTSQEGRQPVRHNWHLTRDLLAFSDPSFFGGTELSEISTSSASKHDKIQKVQVSKKREQSPGGKRMRNSKFSAVRPTSVPVGNHGKRAQSYPSRKNKVNRNGRSSVIKSVLSKVKKLSALKMKKRNVKESSRKGEEYDLMDHNAENQVERGEIADDSLEMNTLHVSEQLEELAIRPSEPDHAFQPTEDYERLLFGTEAEAPVPAPNELHYGYDLDMFSADETEHVQSFPEVDPIPIPGPPGSFLPSPRDMGSEDFQGNSSLTTSRVHSSLDHHDVVDGDSSGSSMSASSTISNSAADRCNFKSSVGPCAESSLRSVDTVPQEKNGFDGWNSKIDRIYVDKGSLGLENDQPCCCQRKERLLNLQESELLRRRTVAAMTFPAGGNYNSNPISADLDGRPDLAPKMILPAMKPFTGTISFRDSANPIASSSASPSASNPVLRLMGKNLLVVNKDDATSLNTQISPQVPAFLEASPSNIHNNDSHSLTYRGSYPIVEQYYEGHSGSRLPVNARLPTGMFHVQHTDYSLLARKPVKEMSIINGAPESENTAIDNAVKGNTSLVRRGSTSGSTALHFSQGFS